jgi:uncharacterized protein with ParB-like and HNH nuclease domain
MKNDIKILANEERSEKGNLFSFLDLIKKENIGFKEFSIPIFQRNYSWDTENLDDFVNSFDHFFDKITQESNFPEFCDDNQQNTLSKNFFTDKIKPVFFGSIYAVLADNKNKLTLIDGQQRITTLLIFLLAQFFLLNKYEKEIENAINALDDSSIILETHKKLKSNLKRMLFTNIQSEKYDEVFTLKTDNLNDKEIWDELLKIISGNGSNFADQDIDDFDTFEEWMMSCQKKLKNSRNNNISKKCVFSNIFNAFSYAVRYFEKRIERQFNLERWSKKVFAGCGEENFKYLYLVAISMLFIFDICDLFDVGVFCLNSDKSEDISNLFEAINSKGKQLSAFDLLKNEIYQVLLRNNKKNIEDTNLFSQKMKRLEDNITDSYTTSEKSDYLVDLYKSIYIDQIKEKEIMDVEKKGIFKKFRALLNNHDGIYYNDPYKFIAETTKYFETYNEMFPKKLNEYAVDDNAKKMENLLVFKIINILKYKPLKSMMVGAWIAAEKNGSQNVTEERTNICQIFKRMAYLFTYNLKRTAKKANWHDAKFRKLIYRYLKQDQKNIKGLVVELASFEKEKDDEFFKIINNNELFKNTIKKIFEDDKEGYNDFFENSDVAKAILHDVYSKCNHEEKYNILLNFEYDLEHILPQSENTNDSLNGEIYKVGNLMLLTKKTNSANSNKSLKGKLEVMKQINKFTEIVKFDEEIYSNDELSLQHIAEKKDYIDNNDIVRRTERFSEFLMSTFDFK